MNHVLSVGFWFKWIYIWGYSYMHFPFAYIRLKRIKIWEWSRTNHDRWSLWNRNRNRSKSRNRNRNMGTRVHKVSFPFLFFFHFSLYPLLLLSPLARLHISSSWMFVVSLDIFRFFLLSKCKLCLLCVFSFYSFVLLFPLFSFLTFIWPEHILSLANVAVIFAYRWRSLFISSVYQNGAQYKWGEKKNITKLNKIKCKWNVKKIPSIGWASRREYG